MLKTQIRKVREAIAEGKLDVADAQLRLAAKKLDRAATARVIHANLAARVKSRLSAAIKVAKTSKKK